MKYIIVPCGPEILSLLGQGYSPWLTMRTQFPLQMALLVLPLASLVCRAVVQTEVALRLNCLLSGHVPPRFL